MVDAAVVDKYIMLRDVDSKYFTLRASFIEGSSPSFSTIRAVAQLVRAT